MNLIAHRGGAGLRVENTLAAFENAIALGAPGAELDVHLTRDGQVVVHHDDCLNGAYCRDASGHWLVAEQGPRIADLTLAELQRYEIGVPDPASAYVRKFDRIKPVAEQKIPLLRDVIDLAKARSERFLLVVEIKASILEAARRPWHSLVDATLKVIDEEDFADRVVLCSFDWGALLYARRQRPDLRTWFTSSPLSWLGSGTPPSQDIPPGADHLERLRALYRTGDAPWFAGFDPRRFAGGYPEAVAAAGGNAWFPYYRDCTQEHVRQLADLGLESAVWSVNLRDADELRRLARMGVDHAVIDYPDMDVERPSPA